MAIIKCKMCGGSLNIEAGMTVCECEYCGSKQTIPTADNEKKLTLFARAGRLMRSCEFDAAAGIYESIVAEFPEESEAYWGLVISKYGIEYVDDPATGKKVPTCHRSSFTSVMEDDDFTQACENADPMARRVYREEAKQIEELRKEIIDVSANEQPYDVFISYKEKDDNGERTPDSVLAQDIYDALTDKGYRVFFSRISLEDKLGMEYEPYIFAALNSAKLMLVVGTDYEHFNAAWVKNEWSRYLKLMAKDKSKRLIPCFMGCDAYDMPKEFNKLAAQNLGKVGAVQDLLRGVDKLIGKTGEKAAAPAQTVVQQVVGGPNTAALLDRGNMALEDCNFSDAKNYFNQVLNMDARCAEAYLGIAMAKAESRSRAEFGTKIANGLQAGAEYNRAKQFASAELRDELERYEAENAERLRRKAEKKAEEERIKAEKKAEEAKIKAAKEAKIAAEIKEIKMKLADIEAGNYVPTAEEKERLSELETEANHAKTRYEQAETELAAMPELADMKRIAPEIDAKKKQLSGLGIFKGREKKILQEQIAAMEKDLQKASAAVEQKKQLVARLEKISRAAQDKKNTLLAQIASQLQSKLTSLCIPYAKIGDAVAFGSYPQDKGAKKRKAIEWLVLDKEDSRVLLVSKYALDCKPYNTMKTDATWDNCTLRRWLNKEFISTAFTAAEAAMIAESTVTATEKNYFSSASPGKATKDKVYILSRTEAEKYFASAAAMRCAPTAYAKSGEATCWWWLRPPGHVSDKALLVLIDSSGNYSVDDVNSTLGCVRPALWIKLES